MSVFDERAFARYQANPCLFIEEVLYNPETGKPFQLYPAQREFFTHAWEINPATGRLLYEEQTYGAPKKTGKSLTAALHGLTTILLYGGRYATGLIVSNSLEQSLTRVFQQMVRICENSPLLKNECEITSTRIRFPATGAVISCISSSDISAAGAEPTFVSIDELHGAKDERCRRLFDELGPVPSKKISVRLVTSYASYAGEFLLLEEIYQRGMQLPEIGNNLHAGNGQLFAWHHDATIAPWVTPEWLQKMREKLLPQQYQRLYENRFVGSEDRLITPANLDGITDPNLQRANDTGGLVCCVGVDVSKIHDASAIMCVGYNPADETVRLMDHHIWPGGGKEISLKEIEDVILYWHGIKFNRLAACYYDPYQFLGPSQRLKLGYVPLTEISATASNNHQMTENLLSLIKHHRLTIYQDDAIRKSLLAAVIETDKNDHMKIDKVRRSDGIDAAIALALACLAAVRSPQQSSYIADVSKWGGGDPADPKGIDAFQRRALSTYLHSNGLINIRNRLWPW